MNPSIDKQRNIVAGILDRSRTLRKKCNKLSIRDTIKDVKSFIEFCTVTKKEALHNHEFVVADFCEDESLTWALRIRSFFDIIPYKFSTISRHSRRTKQLVRWQHVQIPIAIQCSFEHEESIKFFAKHLGLEPYSYNYHNLEQNVCYRLVKPGGIVFSDFLEEIEKEGFSWIDKIKKISSNLLSLPREHSSILEHAFSVKDIKHYETKQLLSSNIHLLVSYRDPQLKISDHTNLSSIILEATYKIAEQGAAH